MVLVLLPVPRYKSSPNRSESGSECELDESEVESDESSGEGQSELPKDAILEFCVDGMLPVLWLNSGTCGRDWRCCGKANEDEGAEEA